MILEKSAIRFSGVMVEFPVREQDQGLEISVQHLPDLIGWVWVGYPSERGGPFLFL